MAAFVPELIQPSAVASFLQVAFNPRDDIELDLEESSFLHSSDTPHRIYEGLQQSSEVHSEKASSSSESADESSQSTDEPSLHM